MNNIYDYKHKSKMAQFNGVRPGGSREGWEGEAVTHGHHCIGHILFIVLGGGHKGVYHIILKIFLNDFILKK